jgi:TPR repeat protein
MKKILFAVCLLSSNVSNVFAIAHPYKDALQRRNLDNLKEIMGRRMAGLVVDSALVGGIVGAIDLLLRYGIASNKILFIVVAGGITAAVSLREYFGYKSPRALDAMCAEAEALMREGDCVNAGALYELAAIGGHSGAQYAFGRCLMTGSGVAQNAARAAHYLGLAANQGHVKAIAALQNAQSAGEGDAND